MLVGVISDTHDHIASIEKGVELLNAKEVDLVVHCGDFVAPFVWLTLSKLRCPIKAVFGNNDGDKFRHLLVIQKLNLQVQLEERFLNFTIDTRKIALFHGDYAAIVEALVCCQKYDAVFHGHTHVAVNEMVDKTLSLNPGTFLPLTPPNTNGGSLAIYDTKTNSAEVIAL